MGNDHASGTEIRGSQVTELQEDQTGDDRTNPEVTITPAPDIPEAETQVQKYIPETQRNSKSFFMFINWVSPCLLWYWLLLVVNRTLYILT